MPKPATTIVLRGVCSWSIGRYWELFHNVTKLREREESVLSFRTGNMISCPLPLLEMTQFGVLIVQQSTRDDI